MKLTDAQATIVINDLELRVSQLEAVLASMVELVTTNPDIHVSLDQALGQTVEDAWELLGKFDIEGEN